MKKKANILLVDDNKMDVELTIDAFTEARLDNKIHVVYSGEEALSYMFGKAPYADREKYPLPDLTLLDLKMSGLSGIDVLKTLKQTEKLKRIPIIILTTSRDEYDRASCYEYGANSYLVKPVSFEGFINVVRAVENYWIQLNVKPPL